MSSSCLKTDTPCGRSPLLPGFPRIPLRALSQMRHSKGMTPSPRSRLSGSQLRPPRACRLQAGCPGRCAPPRLTRPSQGAPSPSQGENGRYFPQQCAGITKDAAKDAGPGHTGWPFRQVRAGAATNARTGPRHRAPGRQLPASRPGLFVAHATRWPGCRARVLGPLSGVSCSPRVHAASPPCITMLQSRARTASSSDRNSRSTTSGARPRRNMACCCALS